MAFKAKSNGNGNKGGMNPQEAMEAGTYEGRLVQLIDLGVQPQRAYQGQEKPPCHQIYTTYEFVEEFCVDADGNEMEDKPRWLSEDFPFFPLDADLAKCTKRYKALDPKIEHDGDWEPLLGAPVNVTITAKPNREGVVKNYISMTSSMTAKKAAKVDPLVNPTKIFMLDDPDMEVYKSLPQWLQEKIAANLEFKGSKLEALLGGKQEAPKKEEPKPEPEYKADPQPDADDGDVPW